MNYNSFYSGSYEPTNDSDSDSSNEDENEDFKSSDEEIDEKEFNSFYFGAKKKAIKNFKTKKEKVQDVVNDFEAEMDNAIDNIIQKEEEKYFGNKIETVEQGKLALKPGTSKAQAENEEEEDEDTDSEAEMETGVRTTKKRVHYTNDELLYDPDLDDKDQEWINKQRKTCKKVVSPSKQENQNQKPSILKPTGSTDTASSASNIKYLDAKTDAILNCPCCMTLLCMDCQRHETYKTQYRAMFVFNCHVKNEEQLKYPKDIDNDFLKIKSKRGKNRNKKRTEQDSDKTGDNDDLALAQTEDKYDLYKPVSCKECMTEIGVYDDKDELYHFFNVIASHA